jgi:hypothetical protein
MNNKSWKPEVKVDGSWASNGLRFATQTEAFESAMQTRMRWWMVDDVRATESEDAVNYRMADGKLTAVEPVGA